MEKAVKILKMYVSFLLLLLNLLEVGRAVEIQPVTQSLGIIGDHLVTSVGIGDPPQFFDLSLDVTDDKLLILDVKTHAEGLDYQYNYVKNLFVPEESNTLEMTSHTCRRTYVVGSYTYHVDGLHGKDIITLGGLTFENKSVRFCDLNTFRNGTQIYNDPIDWLMKMPIDGFLGIKPGGEDVLEKIGLPTRQITFYVDSKATEPDNAGWITFGGPDTTHCKEFVEFQTDDSDSWTAWVTKATFNNKVTTGTFSTLFDLKNTTLVVPKDVYNNVVNYFGGSKTYISCSKTVPDITLTIFAKEYIFPLQRILKPMVGSSSCQLDLASSGDSDENQIILNRYILDYYCLLFDYDESNIALAPIVTKKLS